MPQLTYCPICGHTLGTKEEGGRLRQACPNCGYVHYVNPVPAVGILIEMDGGVVLIRRLNPPHQGEWTLPSGFIEADESAEDAAIREAEEETGLKVETIEMLGVNSFPEGPPVSGIMIFFRAKPVGGKLKPGDDATEVAVFSIGNIPRLPFRTHREVMATWLARQQKEDSPVADIAARDDFLIRPAEMSDLDELMALLALIPPNRGMARDDRQRLALRLQELHGIEVFVAQSRQTPPLIIGFIALSVVRTLTEGIGFINDMAVLPTYQRRGVGAALLEVVMKRADRLNLCHLMVNTERANERARAFYAALGFDDAAVMHLKLR